MFEPNIPIATDNIYKFYALFGLALFLAGAFTFVYVHQSSNEVAYRTFIEIEALRADEHRSKLEDRRLAMLEQKQEVDVLDKKSYLEFIGVGIGISLGCMAIGFFIWQTKIQTQADRLQRLQLEKLALEIRALRRVGSHRVR